MTMYARAPNTGKIYDFLIDIFDEVPGSEWIKGAAESGAGWIGDMAKKPLGFFILQAITNGFYGPLAYVQIPGNVSGMQVLGPQIASVLWAVPGMVAGESFTDAYAKEFIIRVVKLIEYFGGVRAPDIVKAQFSEPVKKLLTEVPEFQQLMATAKAKAAELGLSERDALKALHLTPEELAVKFNVRPDSVAAAANAALHKFIYNVGDPNTSEFDGTGHHVRAPDARERPPGTPPPLVPVGPVIVKGIGKYKKFPIGGSASSSTSTSTLGYVTDFLLLAGAAGSLFIFGRTAYGKYRSRRRRSRR